MRSRKSGILLHITSLPSPYGIGDLGSGAYEFADFLEAAGQSVWQILPLTPTSFVCGNSPYCGPSAFAGNPLMISPDLLVRDGLLLPSDLGDPPAFPDDAVRYEAVREYKYGLLRLAHARYEESGRKEPDFERFREENGSWLDDYALFVSLKEKNGGAVWSEWPRDQRDRQEPALDEWRAKLAREIGGEMFFQYLFFKQWLALKRYCNRKNIQIIGDIPIYVSYDSPDAWVHWRIFKLDDDKRPTYVAGVPPDYFSETGQLWGNPVYNWDVLGETQYAWWLMRFEHNLRLFDLVRVDHFRGLVAYWEVPASEQTAVNGKWVEAPARDFFGALSRRFPFLPIIAEDLGVITPDVREIAAAFEFPGMKLLLFAFGEDLPTNPYAPHNHMHHCVVYTGTHDNNTIKGWFRRELDRSGRERLRRYLGRDLDEDVIHWELIRLAMMSVANMVVFQLQDVLGLGEEARMNVPSVPHGNWEWRLAPGQLTPGLTERLSSLTHLYGRA